jgi:hypothetical protein
VMFTHCPGTGLCFKRKQLEHSLVSKGGDTIPHTALDSVSWATAKLL